MLDPEGILYMSERRRRTSSARADAEEFPTFKFFRVNSIALRRIADWPGDSYTWKFLNAKKIVSVTPGGSMGKMRVSQNQEVSSAPLIHY